jgi:GTP-binding protein HflX
VVVVSARTGEGIDDLVAALDDLVPRPPLAVDVLLPFTQGRLVARVHEHGEVESEEHTEHGTRLRARVPERLAGELARYSVASSGAE